MSNRPYGFEICLVNVKTMRMIVQIFVAFSEKLNFSYKIFCCSYFSKEGRSLGRISLVDFILNISKLSTKLIKEIQIQELFFQY